MVENKSWTSNTITADAVTPKRTDSTENIGNLSIALKNALSIPEAYRQPQGLRPEVSHDTITEETDRVPVIDLKDLSAGSEASDDRTRIVKEIGNACREWGFFKILNHGLPLRLLYDLRELAIRFFQQPAVEKERASFGQVGYDGRHLYMPERVHWVEMLNFLTGPDSNVADILNATCFDCKDEFISAIDCYIHEIRKMTLLLLELMAESLGLQKSFFTQHFDGSFTSVTRFNYYPPCPQPSQALGLFAHVDSNCITILNEDEVGGLQIFKDGRWIPVRPLKDALVVNVGDSLQAWTNGHFKSVEHRAVLNLTKPRLSAALFCSPKGDAIMAPPMQLVDENHPLLYRPFTWAEYFPRMQKKRMEGKVGIDRFMRLDFKEDECM